MNASTDEQLGKVYSPSEVEGRLYAKWKANGYFRPGAGAESFSMVVPPPNVTGRLHCGHALTGAIEDTLVRWHRMRGYSALWVPGTDHAGIATQVMVERELAKSGEDRLTMGRDAFLEKVWEWKHEHGGIIDMQHERLGASVDWSRYRFTMDDVSARAVREAFCRLYADGLVYRAYRLTNWDWASQTVLSDLEVEHREVDGKIYHVAYQVEGSDEKLVVATTRPETLLGDTAVAVHPDDQRYTHLIGKHVRLPLADRLVPIVADAILVDPEFGTGVVKVTPAHDFNDFETGKRHSLELISVIDRHGKLCAPAPQWLCGMTVADGRKAVVQALEEMGALLEVKPHKMSVGHSQRTGVVVEPMASHQWYVKVAPMAEKALEAVRSGETKIYPAHRTQDYYRWMENIHDWCISRQLWWGHRIPAWYCTDCGETTVSSESDVQQCQRCGAKNLAQDEDVLDTWFSSGMWPLSTLGWPDATEDLSRFYPLSVMETGADILFFWVARMMMFGCHFTGKAPFGEIFLHSMVLGEDGSKMSKMKGNVVDPLELIEEFGTDALRFYLCTMAGQDGGIIFSRARVEGYRNFCNKLWNVARFAQMYLEGYDAEEYAQKYRGEGKWHKLPTTERWILTRAAEVATEVDRQLSAYRLDLAAHCIYQFAWYELCDWYVELSKLSLRRDAEPSARLAAQGTLVAVLDLVMRVLHPMMPFLTEEIWQSLPKAQGEAESLMLARFPVGKVLSSSCGVDPYPGLLTFAASQAAVRDAAWMKEVTDAISTIRMLKAESRVPPAKKVDVIWKVAEPGLREMVRAIAAEIAFVGRCSTLEVVDQDASVPKESASSVVGSIEVVLPLAGLVDVEEEKARLRKELAAQKSEHASLQKKLENAGFLAKAPADVVEKERARLAELEDRTTKQSALLARLS